jgi:hypothetical protein
MEFEFSQEIFKKIPKISNLMKIRPVGAELFHSDEQTGRRADKGGTYLTKQTVAFRNFVNAPKKAEKKYGNA